MGRLIVQIERCMYILLILFTNYELTHLNRIKCVQSTGKTWNNCQWIELWDTNVKRQHRNGKNMGGRSAFIVQRLPLIFNPFMLMISTDSLSHNHKLIGWSQLLLNYSKSWGGFTINQIMIAAYSLCITLLSFFPL
jgi:hypothetical protein